MHDTTYPLHFESQCFINAPCYTEYALHRAHMVPQSLPFTRPILCHRLCPSPGPYSAIESAHYQAHMVPYAVPFTYFFGLLFRLEGTLDSSTTDRLVRVNSWNNLFIHYYLHDVPITVLIGQLIPTKPASQTLMHSLLWRSKLGHEPCEFLLSMPCIPYR